MFLKYLVMPLLYSRSNRSESCNWNDKFSKEKQSARKNSHEERNKTI